MPKGIYIRTKTPWNKGTKGIMKAWNKGITGFKHSEETKKKISLHSAKNKPWLGKKKPAEVTERMIATLVLRAKRGKDHWSWKGTSPENNLIRGSSRYRLWRKSVFERDNYTCVHCGLKSGNGKTVVLNADHIKPFAHYPELRFAVDNGRTLCIECHRKTDTWGNRLNSNKKKYENKTIQFNEK